MKKIFIALFVVAVVICALNEEPKKTRYAQEEMWDAIAEAEREAYKRGYDEGEYYASGELERIKSEYDHYMDSAYEAGYEIGYEDGYYDCLEEHGLVEKSAFDPDDPPRIKKDK